jgi:hypothetical protein
MKIIEKRAYDSRLYDIACGHLLDPGETITSIVTITADQGGMAFGAPVLNTLPASYPNGAIEPIGTVIQVRISAGAIPQGSDNMGIGVPNLLCTIRTRFITSLGNQIEATTQLLLQDQIAQG